MDKIPRSSEVVVFPPSRKSVVVVPLDRRLEKLPARVQEAIRDAVWIARGLDDHRRREHLESLPPEGRAVDEGLEAWGDYSDPRAVRERWPIMSHVVDILNEHATTAARPSALALRALVTAGPALRPGEVESLLAELDAVFRAIAPDGRAPAGVPEGCHPVSGTAPKPVWYLPGDGIVVRGDGYLALRRSGRDLPEVCTSAPLVRWVKLLPEPHDLWARPRGNIAQPGAPSINASEAHASLVELCRSWSRTGGTAITVDELVEHVKQPGKAKGKGDRLRVPRLTHPPG